MTGGCQTGFSGGCAQARRGRTFRRLREPLQPVAHGRRVGSHSVGGFKGLRWRHPNDRFLVDPGASARRQRSKKQTRSRCMGCSRGGLTTKIHALVDACGFPPSWKSRSHDGRCAGPHTDQVDHLRPVLSLDFLGRPPHRGPSRQQSIDRIAVGHHGGGRRHHSSPPETATA